MAQAAMVAAAIFVIGQAAPMAACKDGSGCGNPAARKDDGIKAGDGGIWVTQDGGTWFLPSDPFERPLRATPDLRALCMLRSGNLTGRSDYEENSQGVWIGDIPMILGRPNSRAQADDGAQMTYVFALPRDDADVVRQRAGSDGARPKRVTLSLTFEHADAVWPPASDGVPMDDPYFLTRVSATGIEAPECWMQGAQDSVVPCDECKRSGRDFFLCKDLVKEIKDCYAR